MNPIEVDVRPAARADLDAYTLWLRTEAGADVAERFARAAKITFDRLATTALIGPAVEMANPRLTGLRKWRIDGFPKLLVFYMRTSSGVSVVRVFHGAQNWASQLDAD